MINEPKSTIVINMAALSRNDGCELLSTFNVLIPLCIIFYYVDGDALEGHEINLSGHV